MTCFELFPTLSRELVAAFRNDGCDGLAELIPSLKVLRSCCRDDACASFYTSDVTHEDIVDRGKRIIPASVPGLSCVFVVDDAIAFVELTNRPDVRAVLDQHNL